MLARARVDSLQSSKAKGKPAPGAKEAKVSERYSVNQDPCGLFFIWDERKIAPVMDDDNVLAFASMREANRAAFKLNGPANDDWPRWTARVARLAANGSFARTSSMRHDLFLA